MVSRLILPTLLLLFAAGPRPEAGGSPTDLSVRITSPLGRTGIPERIRIVAQIKYPEGATLEPVRFFVDSQLLAEDTDGPPFAVEWTDANPLAPTEIAVEVRAAGAVARDKVLLEPFEVTEEAEVSSVLLEVAVHDKEGQFVSGLTDRDFRVLEDDVPQTIDIARPENMAATYTLLVDSSQSMSRRIEDVRLAAAMMVKNLRADDQIVVAPFSNTIGAITGPTRDHQTVLDAIQTIGSRGGTAILNALRTVADSLPASDERHALVLLTAGYDEHSTVSREEAIAAVKRLRATLYVIGIAGSAGISLRGEQFLRDLAAETGGKAFFPSRDTELDWVDQRIAEEVQKRYLVSYSPSNQKVDGTWRTIRLLTTDTEHKVRTRSGYYAPAPPPIRPSIEFTMMNGNRELVDVSAADLTVIENGVAQQIDVFQEAVDPVSIVLALDSSGSMKKATEGAQAAARSFVHSIRQEDKLALATFADRVWFAHDLTENRAWSLAAIDQYVASGGTALYDGLVGSFTRLKREKGRRVVVLVSDGRDENNAGTGPGSQRTVDDVFAGLKESEATVFAIGLGPRVDREFLERVATESGGEAYFPLDVSELEAHYRRVVENLRRRYVISYTSTNTTRDGAWRTVQIESRSPDSVVRSKGGYFAPDK